MRTQSRHAGNEGIAGRLPNGRLEDVSRQAGSPAFVGYGAPWPSLSFLIRCG